MLPATHSRGRTAISAYAPHLALCALGALLLWHCRHGLCHSDEAFYLALVHRFWTGDRLLIDEWQIAQVYAPILLPAYHLFRVLIPSGKGVYLAFRLLYVAVSLIAPLLLLTQAKRDRLPKLPALVCAALLVLYSRANINGPSYYNLCLHFLTLSVLLAYVPPKATDRAALVDRIRPLLAGVCFALACICCPVLVLFLPVYLYLAHALDHHSLRLVVVGGLACVFVYLIPIFAKASLTRMLTAAQTVLSDPEHQQGLIDRVAKVVYFWLKYASLAILPVTCVAAGEVAYVYTHRHQRERMHQRAAMAYPWVVLLFVLYTVRTAKTSICFIVTLPAGFLLLPYVVRSLLVRDDRLPFGATLYLTGVALALSFFFGSNTGLDAMTGGLTLGTIGGIWCWSEQLWGTGLPDEGALVELSGQAGRTSQERRSLPTVVCFGTISVVLVAVFAATRFLGTYRDAPLQRLTVEVQDGPAAGLLTTAEHKEAYDTVLEALRVADEDPSEGGVFVSRLLPWAYVASGRSCCTPTAWALELSDERLMSYYQDGEHEFPRMVLVAGSTVGGFETAPFNDHQGYDDFNFNDFSGPFYDWLLENSTPIVENDYATLYRVN